MGRFDALVDIEFEDFVADLLSAVTGLKFVAGTRGGDRGIDALSVVDGKRHVIQCKHYVKSDFNALKRSAREELERLGKLGESLASYRFVTSMELSHTQRDELTKILGDWVGSRDHVLGGKELIVDLGNHSGVETHHAKLWFTGAGQLRRQLSAAQYQRRSALLDEIRPSLPRFVETDAFEEAGGLLRDRRVCIVDGPPGVGKTTLAQLLLVDSLENGFEPFEVVRGQLGKAWELLDVDERQVFYFDDFLGRVKLFEARDDDEDLVRFARAIARDEKRRLVMTTRDYIFTEARRGSDTLYREVDDAQIFFLTPEGYTRWERARIFYNHLYFSHKVDGTARNALLRDDRHLEVIDHPNFSPRLIEWITGFAGNRLRDGEKQDYGLYCLAVMSSPNDLWRDPFDELDEHEKALLLAFLGLPGRVGVEDLREAFLSSCAGRGLDADAGRFERVLMALDNTFIAGMGSGDRQSFSLMNPSLIDHLERYVVTGRGDVEATLRGALFFAQVEWLWDACRKDADLPPRPLWPAFEGAFSTVIESPSIEDPTAFHMESDDPYPRFRDLHQEETRRLESMLGHCEHQWFRESCARWLSPYASGWACNLGVDGMVVPRELKILARLFEYGILGSDSVGPITEEIESLEPMVCRWKLFDVVKTSCPEVVSAGDIARWKSELEEFVVSVLEEPELFHESEGFVGTEAFDELMDLMTPWGISPDVEKVDIARNVIYWTHHSEVEEAESMEREAMRMDGEEMDDEEPVAETGVPEGEEEQGESATDEDAMIDALFGRITEEPWGAGDAEPQEVTDS